MLVKTVVHGGDESDMLKTRNEIRKDSSRHHVRMYDVRLGARDKRADAGERFHSTGRMSQTLFNVRKLDTMGREKRFIFSTAACVDNAVTQISLTAGEIYGYVSITVTVLAMIQKMHDPQCSSPAR